VLQADRQLLQHLAQSRWTAEQSNCGAAVSAHSGAKGTTGSCENETSCCRGMMCAVLSCYYQLHLTSYMVACVGTTPTERVFRMSCTGMHRRAAPSTSCDCASSRSS
jgi:hypothetical protein